MNKKDLARIVLLIVIVVLLGAVGCFIFVKKSGLIAQRSTPAPAGTQTTALPPTPENSFTNPSGNYSFEVPSAWNAAINRYNGKNSLFGPNADSGSGLGGVEIFSNQSSIDAFLGGVDAQYTDETNITIDGISGVKPHAEYGGQYKGENKDK